MMDPFLNKKNLSGVLPPAILVLLFVSLSRTVTKDTLLPDQQPSIGGSGDNRVLGLIVNYNGIPPRENRAVGPGGSANTLYDCTGAA
jgi:hypothetical protein